MIKIVAENYIKEEHQKEFLKLTKELIILSREEAGNISYHLYQDIQDPSHYTFVEEWQNQEAIDLHNQNILQRLFHKSKALHQNHQERLNIKRSNNEYIRNNLFKKQC